MLNIRSQRCLARILGVPRPLLNLDDNRLDGCVRELDLIDPAKPGKKREVIHVGGVWRRLVDGLLERVLLPRIQPSPYNHGGVRGRSILTNASAHAKSVYVYTADISNFFPSIHFRRVYELFKSLGCSPDVAGICTRLCTYNYHLAVGLPTSPLLSDHVLDDVDKRIHGACEQAGLTYTRYIDDLTVSGSFNFERSGFIKLIPKILEEHGFQINDNKSKTGRLSDGTPVTKIRIRNGKPDVTLEYLQESLRQIEDASVLAQDGEFKGPYYTKDQIYGRIAFVRSIRSNRGRVLLGRFKAVPWSRVEEVAESRGLVAARKRTEARS